MADYKRAAELLEQWSKEDPALHAAFVGELMADSATASRRIIQICVTGVANTSSTQCNMVTTALCNDGTVWELRDNTDAPQWVQLPPIPDA